MEKDKKLSTHNVEQMARGYLMYQLARQGYNVQITDSRFPKYDLLVVSPGGKHFGIEVKGQRTKNFWRFNDREPKEDMFYAFVFVPEQGNPRVFIMNSKEAMKLWKEYYEASLARGYVPKKNDIWGVNWKTPFPFEDNYQALPK